MKIKRNIILMFLIALFQGMVFYGAISTLYRLHAGISVFEITLIESISIALALILELPWGIISEKIGYKTTLIICNLIYVFSKVIFFEADSFAMFLCERLLLSIVCSGISGVDSSILYLSCRKEDAHKIFSIYDNLGTLGLLIAGGAYTLFMANNYHLTALATIFSYSVALVLTLFLKEVKDEEEKKRDSIKDFCKAFKETFSRKELFLFIIGIALFSECHQTITVFFNQIQYVKTGMDDKMIGIAYIIMLIASLCGMLSSFLTKILKRRTMGIVLIIIAIGCSLCLAFTNSPYLSIVSIVCLRVAFSLMMPLVSVIENEQVSDSNRATTLSIYSLIMDGIAIFTNLILGKVCEINITLAFAVSAGFLLISLFLFFYGTIKMKIE